MVTKLLSYFCSLTKVSAISCDLFGSCAVGHAIHSGLERMEREEENGEEEKVSLATPCYTHTHTHTHTSELLKASNMGVGTASDRQPPS